MVPVLKQPTISGRSKLVGVMGWPVSHSLSPAMQNAAIKAAGLEAAYVPLPVAPHRVSEAVHGLRALGFRGCNVTIPHKIAVIEYLDSLTSEAQLIGAVNSIRVEDDGRLVGHNTDCIGAVRAMEEEGTSVCGKTVLIVGAGGAGRGAAAGCALAGARKIILLNRTVEKAEEVIEELRDRPELVATKEWMAAPLSDGFSDKGLPWEEIDAVFQMSSMGMKENRDLPLDVAWLSPRCHVLDAVYAPLDTVFLKGARAKGLRTTDGLAMLMEQGAAAFEFWFGHEPSREVMRSALLAAASEH